MSAAWWSRAGWLVAVALCLAGVPSADAATLRLDGTFGQGGIARVAFNTGFDPPHPLRPARQPDGKVIVAATQYGDHGNSQTLLARFTRSGRPDPTFGHRGWQRLGYRWNFEPYALHVHPDGRILVLGADGYGPFMYPSPGQFGLLRLLSDGTPDRTFGTNGFVAWNPPWRADTLTLYALPGVFVPERDGRVLAAGTVEERRWSGDPYTSLPVDVPRRVAFVRFNENGSVDESFGNAGVLEELAGTDFFFHAWAALPDGDLVTLASRSEGSAPSTSWLIRFHRDGTLDQGFGQGGSLRLELKDPSAVRELVPTRDGGLLILREQALRRIRPSGQLDAQFGTTCDRLPRRAFNSGGAATTSDGGVIATGTRFLIHARPRRIDSFVFRYGSDGCMAGQPLRIRALTAGPPLLQGRHIALIEATDDHGLALVRIRR
jgi:uncharacterized delta-60 repeat protein